MRPARGGGAGEAAGRGVDAPADRQHPMAIGRFHRLADLNMPRAPALSAWKVSMPATFMTVGGSG